ncbi:MAG TPA: hypothetical protein PLD20_30065 [Blastocatellia bacterium]|nr:hypothetical protein [Blastocatellia bacterium]HMX25140.1 hypothetical protein [Blastocatellia bacterium]HMZ22216.1 hypothetical protein [Blastocatellia bacterium]HNG32738.1 hypothetical protein [Blastocatellia bacterium]
MSASATKRKQEEFREFNELLNLVTRFEDCTLPGTVFDHRAHMAVACWYLICAPDAEAIPRIQEGIKRYAASQGVVATKERGYHETITLFWVRIIRSYLSKATLECSLVHLVNDLVTRYSDGKFPFEYYSRDRLMSWEAKTNWIEPDLKPLP